jgi:hypothetical protein
MVLEEAVSFSETASLPFSNAKFFRLFAELGWLKVGF